MEIFHAIMNGLVKATIIVAKGLALFIMAFVAFLGIIANSVNK